MMRTTLFLLLFFMALGGIEGKGKLGLESVPTGALLLRASHASRELKDVDAELIGG